MNYRLFYNYHLLGDILIVIFDNEKENSRCVITKDIITIYSDDKLIGVNILNFSKIVKTKANGMIINPPNELIDIINHIFDDNHLERLSYQNDSGFYCYKVEKVMPIDDVYDFVLLTDDKSQLSSITSYKNIKVDDFVAVAYQNYIISNGKIVKSKCYKGLTSNCHICSYCDLGIAENNDIYILSPQTTLGIDIFKENI
jgi:autonomous glycyl radical cofactor GrcA